MAEVIPEPLMGKVAVAEVVVPSFTASSVPFAKQITRVQPAQSILHFFEEFSSH